MRKIREITSEEENFRLEPMSQNASRIKCDSVRPEPIGTILLIPHKITGYDRDCDGSLMARLRSVPLDDLDDTGWETTNIGLYPDTGIVIDKKELRGLIKGVE